MNNEPIAWMREDGVIAFHKQKEVDSQGYKWQPLYTHPVKEQQTINPAPTLEEIIKWQEKRILKLEEKTLTDAEIWDCHDSIDSDNWVIDFARAILRKAQEK
jgi:hypothetical protein